MEPPGLIGGRGARAALRLHHAQAPGLEKSAPLGLRGAAVSAALVRRGRSAPSRRGALGAPGRRVRDWAAPYGAHAGGACVRREALASDTAGVQGSARAGRRPKLLLSPGKRAGVGTAIRGMPSDRAMAGTREALELACGVGGGSTANGAPSDQAMAGTRATAGLPAWLPWEACPGTWGAVCVGVGGGME